MEAKLKRLGMTVVLYLEGNEADVDDEECIIQAMNTSTPKASRIKLPSMVRMFLEEGICPFRGGHPGASRIFVRRDGTAQITCSGCTKSSIAELDPTVTREL